MEDMAGAVGAVNRIVDRLLASDVPLTGEGSQPRPAASATRKRRSATAAERALPRSLASALEPSLADPMVSDILVNAPDEVWSCDFGRMERTAVRFSGPDAIVAAVEAAIAPLGSVSIGHRRRSTPGSPTDPSSCRHPPASGRWPVVALPRRFVSVVARLGDW
jgi:hypothetical protein